MKTILIALALMMNMNVIAQTCNCTITTDPDGGGEIYDGRITFTDLNNEPAFNWLRDGERDYKPDPGAISRLKPLHKYDMVVFLGTWCDDSHDLVPKLEKVLLQTGYPIDKLTMYGVDREKKTKNGEQKKYGITNVPTIILYYPDGKEAGRITESVKNSIEEDLAAIIEGH